MSWLAEALRDLAPALGGLTIGDADLTSADDPIWHKTTTALGADFFVTFAWSEPAARFVRHQSDVLGELARELAVPFLPEVVAAGTDPAILVTRRVPGSSLFAVADSIGRQHAGTQLARFLAAPHADGTCPPAARSGGAFRASARCPGTQQPGTPAAPCRSRLGRHQMTDMPG